MLMNSHLLENDANDLTACRAMLANGSRTFLAASMLLPREVREAACALYAFCRMADDEVDGQPQGLDAVAHLRERLASIYSGRPEPIVADRALAVVVRRYDIPATLLEALIEGFEWDAQDRRYDTLDQVQAYGARVAGTVGAMMSLLMGVRDPAAVARACDLGVAMQLSNIARDVGEDARMGRLYLPRDWMAEAGIDADAWLAAPHFNPALASVVYRLLRVADDLYKRAGAGVACLPLNCRPGINAARLLYAQIGLEVERRGLNSVDGRAVVSRWRKVSGLVQSVVLISPASQGAEDEPLPATKYLVDAVTSHRVVGNEWNGLRNFEDVLSLFERLGRRDRGWLVA
jgi:phytoene synthase